METQSLIKEMEMLNLMFAELEHVRICLMLDACKDMLDAFCLMFHAGAYKDLVGPFAREEIRDLL